jgi:hypothetical protein
MSFALKKPGRLVLGCACTWPGFAIATVIALSAMERSRSRFVNI